MKQSRLPSGAALDCFASLAMTLTQKENWPMSKITPCLWFDGNAEEAANFYASLLPDSRVDSVVRAPSDYPSGSAGDVLVVEFTLAGQKFSGLNGGPYFKFNEAVSFHIDCKDQAEVDRLSDALSAVPEAEQCGWVKDRFGLSWQIVPTRLKELLADPDRAKAKRAMDAMMEMKRIDIAALERAAEGETLTA
jgi:predicted 3-demethylubiquinone-9 3-methyltransferase (glyoxalase superfamily)